MNHLPTMAATARKPKWIAALILGLIIVTVFVWLASWQVDRSTQEREGQNRNISTTLDVPKPLTKVLKPRTHVRADDADQIVTTQGKFNTAQEVLIEKRLQDNEDGYWVVTAFTTDHNIFVPMVRAWVKDPKDVPPAPQGTTSIRGRLLPTEAPELTKKLSQNQMQTPQGKVQVLESLSSAELLNKWEPFKGKIDSYVGSIASDTILSSNDTQNGDNVRAVSLVPQQEQPFNWLNIFYAIQWVIFAGFVLYLWWRLMCDDYQRSIETYNAENGITNPAQGKNEEKARRLASYTQDNEGDFEKIDPDMRELFYLLSAWKEKVK